MFILKRYRTKIISDVTYQLYVERIPSCSNVLVEFIITFILNESQEINSFYYNIKTELPSLKYRLITNIHRDTIKNYGKILFKMKNYSFPLTRFLQ